ncbi:sensor histidine kinase [Pseudoduganella sp. LjRoot289]|uniref:sensor histidine kinase n=1 Tax=Pseudoduganella sp. LjRoot289 TaxID=3342314 RepID=UPI003F501DE9
MDNQGKVAWKWAAPVGAAVLLLSARRLRRRARTLAAGAVAAHSRRDGQALGRRASDRTSSYEQLRDLSAALQTIREEERAHIARELHDDLGQLLATLRVDLSLLLQQPYATPLAVRQMRGMDKLLLQAITSLRRIASNLRPSALDEGGLYYALQTLCDEWEQRHNVACQLDAQEDELIPDDRYSTAVFRIVQESLTNIARHAHASHVWISVRKRDSCLQLRIEDNGRGIAPPDLAKAHSFGLLGMRERVWALGGEIDIGAQQGKRDGAGSGALIAIDLPLPRE